MILYVLYLMDVMSSGIFPTEMKTACVTPVHKKGNQDDVNKYRPVSVLTHCFLKYLKNGTKSQLKTINCGVPQGSILGPLLFLIYIYLPNSTERLNYTLYADDTSVFCKGSNLSSLFDHVNCQLEKIATWMDANKLILNVKKTNYMLFSTRKDITCCEDLYYKNNLIDKVKYTKFRGVQIDDKLSWNYHINDLCKTLAINIGSLYRLKYLPHKTLKMLYHSLVSSHMNYCDIIWGFTTKQNLDRIQFINCKSVLVRLITHSPYLSPSKPLLLKMHILPIQELISSDAASFMFKLSNNLLPEISKGYFTYNNVYHNYNTRNANNFHIPFHCTSTTQSSIFYHGTRIICQLQSKITKL